MRETQRALLTGFLRMVIAVAGGSIAWLLTHDLRIVFAMLGVAWVVYGTSLTLAIRPPLWFSRSVTFATSVTSSATARQ